MGTWVPVSSIGELFIRYWQWAAGWSSSERQQATLKNDAFDDLARLSLCKEDESEVLATLGKVIPRHDEPESRPQILALLNQIDDQFLRIHPRSKSAVGGLRAESIPGWLRRYSEQRREMGIYAESGAFRLLPRGPLCRMPREISASHAETLADRFSALTVYSSAQIVQKGRPIKTEHVVIPRGRADGVSPIGKSGHERIISVPMMEREDELELIFSEKNGSEYISYRLSSSVDVVERLTRAAMAAQRGAMLLAPEFAIHESGANDITAHFRGNPEAEYGLIAAGTGDVADPSGAFPFNEMQLMNGLGIVLWRQRKIWPASITHNFARKLGFVPKTAQIHEASSSGDTLVVADVDALGRVMVLICQDFKMMAAHTLIEELQPDWVIVPIMDTGISESRWPHQRAFELSEVTQSRFLICSGVSLGARLKYEEPISCLCGMGPKVPSESQDIERAFLAKAAQGVPGELFAELTWRTAGWKQSTLGASSID